MREGNYPTGERHPRARLTDKEVDLVRDLHEEGITYEELARRFGLSKSGVAGIVQCRRRAVVLYAPRSRMKAIASRIERLERAVVRVPIEVVTGVPDRPPAVIYVPVTTLTEARLKAIGGADAQRR